MNFPPSVLWRLAPYIIAGWLLYGPPPTTKGKDMSYRPPNDYYDDPPYVYTKEPRIKFKTDLMFFWAVGASIIAVVNGAAVLGLWSTLTACHF